MDKLKTLLTLTAFSAAFMAGTASFAQSDEAANSGETAEAAETAIDAATKDILLGEKDAPLQILEYASLSCSHCQDFEANVWPKIQEKYVDKGLANLTYREVNLNGADLLGYSLARCVPEEQYYPMIFTLFEMVPTWLTSQSDSEGIITELTKIGVLAGLSKDEISQCLDDRDKQEAMIANSQANSAEDEVKGTPTIFVNGERVENWSWDALEPVLDKKLEEAGVDAEAAEDSNS